ATLQDDSARAKLVQQLRALIAAQRGIEKENPDGAAAVATFTKQLDALSGEILAGANMIIDAPRLLRWAHEQISDQTARRLWGEAAFAFGLIFGCAALTEWIVRWVLSRFVHRLPTRRSDTTLVRAFFALLGLLLAVLPIVVFAAVAYAVLSVSLEPYTRT